MTQMHACSECDISIPFFYQDERSGKDKVKQEALSKNILSMGHPEAARDIAKEIRALVA